MAGEPFDFDDIKAWLQPQIFAATPVAGRPAYSVAGPDALYWMSPGELEAPPGRIIETNMFGGPGLVLTEERTHDALAFQFHVRGRQRDWADSKALAWLIDGLIVDAVTPTAINGTRCLVTNRVGNPPTFHSLDPANRATYVCSYVFIIQRH